MTITTDTRTDLRDAIDPLLQEAYEGPGDPTKTWFVSNRLDSGVLGTVKHLTAGQAWMVPDGTTHSVAAHLSHLVFSIDAQMKQARGEPTDEDGWERSFDVGPVDEAKWHQLQRSLRESHLRLRMWVHADEAFATPTSIRTFLATVAHAAYHLGAIRQLATIVMHTHADGDPMEAIGAPLSGGVGTR